MEIGESISVPLVDVPSAGSEEKVSAFSARIVSLKFMGGVKVALNGVVVDGPHWTRAGRGDLLDDWSARARRIKGRRKWHSKKPAAYSLTGERKVRVEVEVTKSENVSGDGQLVGTLGSLRIEGTCPTGAGTHKVDAIINDWSDAVDGLVGKITWTMTTSSPAGNWYLGATFVELYMLLRKPARMYDANGVPAEVLRLLCQKAKVKGKRTAAEVGAAVAKYIHGDHGLRYDTVEGGSAYLIYPVAPIASFPVVDCALRKKVKINCYDQAAAVQSLAGALGPEVQWVFMSPYGFINPTRLVGVKGRCNNPFFRNPTYTDLPYIRDPRDERRSAFGNHAFCSLESKILDACAGPHLGTESLIQYIVVAVDSTTPLNHLYRGLPGTARDATGYPGVITTESTCSV